MKAALIDAYEADFAANLTDNSGQKFNGSVSTQFPFPLTILTATTTSGFYTAQPVPKSMVVLHYTAGYLKGDIAQLTQQDYRVSVPFILARSGMVYQLFSSSFWSYHLGPNASGGNLQGSQRSVPIEISNIGPLAPDNAGNLHTMYGDRYCTLAETQYYTKLDTPYRGFTYFASFTESQYTSLKALVGYLCKKFSIPSGILPETTRYKLFDNAAGASYKGIASHVNFRPDKTDIGPAFNWSAVM
jgi:N-acetylmuramoyl-L-alanine amidase